jgi:hypothetical protein
MTITVVPFRRHLVVQRASRLDLTQALRALDDPARSQGQFVHLHTPIEAFESTRVAALRHGDQVLIAIRLCHLLGPAQTGDRLRLLFDPFADRLGFVNFDLSPVDGSMMTFHHLPYPEARSTRFKLPTPIDIAWHDQPFTDNQPWTNVDRIALLRFEAADLFRRGDWCGFNVARTRGRTVEDTTWSLASGNRFYDAGSLGSLHLRPPAITLDLQVTQDDGGVHLRDQHGAEVELELADALDRRTPLPRTGDGWRIDAGLITEPGRYRLYASVGEQAVAPEAWWLDVAPAPDRPRRPFELGAFVDVPDDLARRAPYTPANLLAQYQQLHGWGVRRVYWIDYAHPKHAALLWWSCSDLATAQRSYRNCGDLLQAVASSCRQIGMPCYGTYKPFEALLTRGGGAAKPARTDATMIDGHVFGMQPPASLNPESAIRPHEQWRTTPTMPVRSLRLVSEAPLPMNVKARDLTLMVSDDNRRYRVLRGKLRVKVTRERRGHVRWSPAGPMPDEGQRDCWVLQVEGLSLRQRFVAVQWTRADVRIRGRAFALVEATDARGQAVHLTLARTGSVEKGFNIHTPRRAWNNHSEPITDWLDLGPGQWGVMLAPLDRLPPVLEPLDPRAREAWLTQVQSIIDRGAAGVDMRWLCHHIDCQDWGSLAFHPAVREAFAQRFGREVQPTEEDLHQVRLLRGQAVTDFMRRASALARKAGVQFILHLESGMDVPPHLHVRNQIHFDWRTWLNEGLIDQVVLKFFGSHHPWVHEQVLPLTRKLGVPVHVCELNGSLTQPLAVERARRLAQEAVQAGLDGLLLYEVCSYQRINDAGEPVAMGNAPVALAAAAEFNA